MVNLLTRAFAMVGGLKIADHDYGVIEVANKTGVSIAAGKMVYISGFDATLNKPTITLADKDTSAKVAQFITKNAIAANKIGYVYEKMILTGQNTNAGNVGDPVYLGDSGAWTLSAPTGADMVQQIVGFITVKSATVGKILFLLTPRNVTVIGSSGLQSDSVPSSKIPAGTVIAADILDNTLSLAKHIDDDSHSIFFVKGEIDFGESNPVDTDLGAIGYKGTLIGGYATVTEAQANGDATTTIKISSAAAGATPICDNKVITLANTGDGQSNKVGSVLGINPIAAGVDMLSTDHVYLYCADDVAGTRSAGKLKVFLIFQKSA